MKEIKRSFGFVRSVDDDYYTIASRLRRLAMGSVTAPCVTVDGKMRWDRLSRFVAGVFAIAKSPRTCCIAMTTR